MKKIFLAITLFIFLSGCGYTPIYSNKNFDFNFSDIIYTENNQLGAKVGKKLRAFSNKNSQKLLDIEIEVRKKINTLTKDVKGNPSRHEMNIQIDLVVTLNRNESMRQSFGERFNYKSNTNRFELKQYEKEVENLLIEKNIEKIIGYLSRL
jgi:hypothetical protein|tara:strand:+ start:314 stop:766 length:453 start_codon:yes stop_codon:yes gene_type:complete